MCHAALQRLVGCVTGAVTDLQLVQRPCREVDHGLSDLQQLRREPEQRGVAAVPGHQLQLCIHHADALAHVLQRGFQQALVEAQHLGRFANGASHRIQRRGATLACGFDQQPCHACADHGRQLTLDGGNPVIIQHLPGVALQQLARTLLAQEATGGPAQGSGSHRIPPSG